MKEILKNVKNKELSSEEKEKIFKNYLETVIVETQHIDIKGIYSKHGASREAINFNIEDISTASKFSWIIIIY